MENEKKTPKKQRNAKKSKAVLAVILACVILVTGIGGYFAIGFQKKAVINDQTVMAEVSDSEDSEKSGGDGEKEMAAVVSQNVTVYTDTEADEINGDISNVKITSAGLYMDVADDSEFNDLGTGDIFFLEGDTGSPLGETYIGKVASKTDSGQTNTYLIETPMVDEVFDQLTFSSEQTLEIDEFTVVETLPGVTVTRKENLDDVTTNLSNDESADNAATTLMASAETKPDVIATDSDTLEGSIGDALLFDYEIDLVEAFGLDDSENPDFQEKYSLNEAGHIKVYRTTTGSCYHRSNCPCVGRSKYEITLTEAQKEAFDPCYLCNPPLLVDNGISNFNSSLTLEGQFGLESLDFGVSYDWDILNGNGINDLSVWAKGNFLASVGIKASLQYELGGRTTELSALDVVKLQGLDEKVFPIIFIGYNGATTVKVSGNEDLRAVTTPVPVTVGFLFYADINGNIGVSASATLSYNKEFSYTYDIVKNGNWVFETDTKEADPVVDLTLSVEAGGDVDAHIGCSINLYVFNLNLLEISLVRFGAEAEGTLKLDYSTSKPEESENLIDAIDRSYYARLYLKLVGIDVKIKAKLSLFGVVDLSGDITESYLFKDITLKEWGQKSATKYIADSMTYNSITASDSEAIYFKDLDGRLIREKDGYQTAIYDEEFFSICGIDQSYLYLLVPNEEGNYNIYRVNKKGTTSKKILEGVTNCLTIDEENIYYVSDFDANAIYKYDRGTEKEELFSKFTYGVQYMTAQGDNFYVVAQDNDPFAAFFGASSYCYLVNANGDVVGDYGANPSLENYVYSEFDKYYYAARMTSSGYLRGTASECYWVARDKSSSVLTEIVSGWNPSDKGIFTTLNNDSSAQGALPYKIVLYKAENGSRINVAEVNSNQAFFTMSESDNGDWYFFDQTDSELILYRMPSDFSSKTAIKTFTLSEIPYNLTDCGMQIMNNRIYFYTMPDNTTSKVLYRYDIV